MKRVCFRFFANFWVTKLKPFSEKMKQSVPKYLNQNLVIASFLENSFQGTLSSKTNVLSISKGRFLVYCRFLSDEVETIFCESEAKRLKVFKSRFGHMMLLRNWLWSYLELKNECSERFKMAFFSFLEVLIDEVETTSWESEAKCHKLFKLTLFKMEGWTLYQCFPCNFYKRRN